MVGLYRTEEELTGQIPGVLAHVGRLDGSIGLVGQMEDQPAITLVGETGAISLIGQTPARCTDAEWFAQPPPTVGQRVYYWFDPSTIEVDDDDLVTTWRSRDDGAYIKDFWATPVGQAPRRVGEGHSYGISWDEWWTAGPAALGAYLSTFSVVGPSTYLGGREIFVVAKATAEQVASPGRTALLGYTSYKGWETGIGANKSILAMHWSYNNNHVFYSDYQKLNGVEMSNPAAVMLPTDLFVLNVSDKTYVSLINQIGMGQAYSSYAETFGGTICEVLVYYRQLTTADRATINAWLMAKHGIE